MQCGIPKRTLRRLIGVSLFLLVVGCLLMVINPTVTSQAIGVFLILISIAGVVGFTSKYIHWEPDVILNDEGIEDCRQGMGVIPWSEIRGLLVDTIRRHGRPVSIYLAISVDDPNVYLSRAKTITRLTRFLDKIMLGSDLFISFDKLEPGINEVCQYLEEKRGLKVYRHDLFD